ncbi:hypothetical protein AXF42_Ash011457 [Apostasia shenzhenica]|uniref:Uncharacterized protein n=1 Tax=Apostasia shenzhenica TaxID=1088818 RepID=A0A2I0BAN9_9ASPA|nr:hypothetical protein AXF42_Ash011457 [Apostasia shenzhenica]
MDSSELMASGLDDHSYERRSFPMVPPLKRVAEEASAASSSSALLPVKKACSDLIDESAMNDWDAELKQELKFSSILDDFSGQEISYEELYLAFKVMQRMFLHAHIKIPDGLKNICQKSIYWQGIPKELSLTLVKRFDMACTFIQNHKMFEKWLLESIDFILEKSMTMHEVGAFIKKCQVEESRSDIESLLLPDITWFLHWLENTEAPYVPKRAKAHSLMLKLAFRKHITREEYKNFGIFRRNCVHAPFYDGYDPNKRFENCKEDCVECRKLFPILQVHFNFMKWLNDGTSETHEFISSLLDVNIALNLKGSMDVPDEVIDDCYVSFFDLPKALIRDCIYVIAIDLYMNNSCVYDLIQNHPYI